MIGSIFNVLIYNPFYNGFIFLIKIIPGGDVGVAVILLTFFVKLALFPTAIKSIKTQIKMRDIEPRMNAIKEKYKDDKATQAMHIMNLYKQEDINPFSSFLMLFIQIPVIFGLYFVFIRGGLPSIHTEILYSFNAAPQYISMIFLGFLDLSKKNLILALLAGATQFAQAQILTPPSQPKSEKPSIREDLARSMSMQMKYVFPVIITVIASRFPAAVALYWVTSNLFSIGQELYVRKNVKKQENRAPDKVVL